MAFKYKQGDVLLLPYIEDNNQTLQNMYMLIVDLNVGGWYTVMNVGQYGLSYKQKEIYYSMAPFMYHSIKLRNLDGWNKVDKDILPLSIKLSMVTHLRKYEAING